MIVAGHAVVRELARVEEDAGWYLLDYQRGEPRRFIEHVAAGVAAAAADPEALLLFSGGTTRPDAGPVTEAWSYWQVADHFKWFGHMGVRERAYLEEFARDSFENLLFGICRFREVAGAMPEHVTMVGWRFKRERFEDLHREAIGWPRERFSYVGVNDPQAIEQALRAEQYTRSRYIEDPYSRSEEFRLKQQQRNPFRRQHGYAISCPEMFTPDKPWL